MDTDNKKTNRRYRLHRKIKGLYRFQVRQKIIYVPDSDDMTNKALRELHEKFNYQIQFEIPS
ncbi:hypothetical protein D0817_24660 [Flavobacterium cupreum]|uniref:Uncharacterized protein n=1 Tax=Flavobacterium cupreum TaxID=2133766 RepID=A0A434A065_9FLAO|nr:hypothetical protein D0817_24660 [Flavobacterium cupreum]